MKKVWTLLSVLVILAVLLAGCGDSKSSGSSAGSGEKVLTVAIGGEPLNLDPATGNDAVTNYIVANIYEGLFAYDTVGNPVPKLAESWTVSDDGLVYTFKIKPAVWSDGVEITAADFVYGVKRSLNYGAAETYYSSLISDYVAGAKDADMAPLEDMDDVMVVALDDKTLEITLAAPCAYFLSLLTQKTYFPLRADVAPLAESTWANSKDLPFSGAFKIESYNPSSEVVLVKNDAWRDADNVELDRIIYLVMPDQQAQLMAFENGEIDFAMSVPQDTVKTYDGKPELFIIDPYVIDYFVTINATGDVTGTTGEQAGVPNPVLQDVEIRRALAFAVNREELLTVLDAGRLQYALYGIVPKGIPGATGDFREEADAVEHLIDYDLEAAKAIMEAKGYGPNNMLKLTYKTNDSTFHSTVAQVLQAQWKEIYVDLDIQMTELRVFFDARSQGNFDLARHANSADYMDPMIYLNMYYSANLDAKVVNDPIYDSMIKEAESMLDPVARMEQLHAAEEYLVKEMVYIIPLIGYSNPELLRAGITGIGTGPDGAVDFAYVRLP
ncbi:MAG: peptide ABC transporter substrate-binding protein [Erysipelotrichaceae bacterium]|jgi:oligopeptide transport system substrate-binding protein|nr:peptide ABC transporter substrate-binding protein [Erysipelotrichaceae bacterium]